MKTRILTLLILLAAFALKTQAQEIIKICDTEFQVDLDYNKATAVIVEKKHKLDKDSYIFGFSRKIKGFNGYTLSIPSTINIRDRIYTITGIGYGAFANYSNFDKLIIPNTVTHIDDYAFYNTNINSLQLPPSLMSIGDYAFFNTKIEDVLIPLTVISMSETAFEHCGKLRRLCVPQQLIGSTKPKKVHKDFKYTLNYTENPQLALMQPEEEEETPIEEVLPVVQRPAIKVTSSDVEMNIPSTTEVAENTFSFIIANEKYQNDPNVDYAMQDGRTFKQYCNKTLGIPEENIRYYENATLNNIRSVVDRIKNTVDIYGKDAKILLYFSGHGIPDENGNSYLLPVDGYAGDVNSGYSLKQLYATLGDLDAGNILVFLDACFSGTQRDENFLVEGTKGLRKAHEEAPKVGRVVVFSASQGDETAHAYPEKGHSLFTYFLLKKLKESKGDIKLGELADYLHDNVRKKAFTILDTNQTPTVQISPVIQGQWKDIKFK